MGSIAAELRNGSDSPEPARTYLIAESSGSTFQKESTVVKLTSEKECVDVPHVLRSPALFHPVM